MNAPALIDFDFGFNVVRVLVIDGTPHFVARDVANVLGYVNPLKAVRDHCKGVTETLAPTAGGEQKVLVIQERDVYRLVMRSRMPDAEQFENWIVTSVLPSIRETGSYGPPAAPDLNDPAFLRTTLLSYTEKVLELQGTLERQAPAVEFANAVRNMGASIDMAHMARLIGWGRNTLFEALRADSVLMVNNLPYQAYMDRGYFKVIEGTRERTDGRVEPTFSTRVTGAGQVYIQRRYGAAGEKSA